MSSSIGSTNSWELMKKLASGITGNKVVSDSDLQNLLKKADKNNDGLIQVQEFKDAFLTAEEYLKLEEEYLKAFDEIAGFDGDKTSISSLDIENAIKSQYSEMLADVPETSSGNGGSSDSSGTTTPNVPPKENTPSPDNLENKDLSVLKTERTDVIGKLDNMRSEKTNAISEAKTNVETAKAEFDANTQAFSDLLSKKTETNEEIAQYRDDVLAYQDAKTAVDSKITEQQGAIDTTNKNITTIKGQISSLVEPPKTVSYFNEETQQTETKDNPAYDEYLKEKERLEDELAEAEADLITQEKEMAALKADLADVENSLKLAIDEYYKAQEAAGALSQEEIDLKAKIDESKVAYDNANKAQKDIESKYDTELDKLEASVIAYNDAIKTKELELPEGYAVKDGKITNGKNNLLNITEDQLPEGYKVDGTSIKDEKGNIVGVTTGDKDNLQLYLTEEIEEDKLTYSSKYIIAKQLFDDSLKSQEESDEELWSDLADLKLSSSELKEIKDLYDSFASDYNSNLDDDDTAAASFSEQASKKFSESDEEKAALDVITGAIKRAEFKDLIRPQTFASYLEENNVDVLNSSDDEMNDLLEGFMTEKYGSSKLSQYYPKLSEIQLAEFLGEEGLSSLEGIDEKGAFEKIEAVLNSETLSPYEQMSLLTSMKSSSAEMNTYFEKYFKEDDSYFYSKLNEMITAENEDETAIYSSSDLIEFIKQYKNLDSTSSVLNSDSENLKTLLSVYESSADKEELSELDTYLGSSVVANLVLQNLDEEDANKYLPILFKTSVSDALSEDGSLSLDPADWGLTDENAISSLSEKYINSDGTTSEKINKVLEDLQSGVIDKSSAKYAVSALLNGKPENLADIQAKTSIGNVSELFSLFNSKPYEAFSPDIELTSQYIEKDGVMPYLLIGPKDADPNEELPVIVYMHGSGEVGAGEAGLLSVGPGKIIPGWELDNFNGYIICPTLSGNFNNKAWDNETTEQYVRDLLKDFESEHKVDTGKIFVGGHSLGGKGAIYMAEHMDDIFSKAFVLSGYASKNGSYDAKNVKIPIIGYTGDKDPTSSDYMYGAFTAGIGAGHVITVNAAHGAVPGKTFNRDVDGNNRSDLFEWLLEDKELPD